MEFGFSIWITSHIVRFVGILLQIEEVLLTRLGIPDVFVASVGDIVVAVVVSIAACVFSVQTLPNAVGIACMIGRRLWPVQVSGMSTPAASRCSWKQRHEQRQMA